VLPSEHPAVAAALSEGRSRRWLGLDELIEALPDEFVQPGPISYVLSLLDADEVELVRGLLPERHLHAEGLPGPDHVAVLEVPHAGEDQRPGSVVGVHQPPARLHQRLEHHHPRQDGKTGEMVGQVLLRHRHVLDRHDAVGGLFHHLVDQFELHGGTCRRGKV